MERVSVRMWTHLRIGDEGTRAATPACVAGDVVVAMVAAALEQIPFVQACMCGGDTEASVCMSTHQLVQDLL